MHILATQIATLDEAGTAVDLTQSPADMIAASFSDTDLSALAAAWEAEDGLPTLRLADLKRLRHPMSVDLYVDRVLSHARVVVLRCLGGLEYWRYGLERIADVAQARGILLAALPGDDRPDPRLAGLSTVPPKALARLDRYFHAGGPDNLRQALRYLASLMGRALTAGEPQTLGSLIRFDPGAGAGLSRPQEGARAAGPAECVGLMQEPTAHAIAGGEEGSPETAAFGARGVESISPDAAAPEDRTSGDASPQIAACVSRDGKCAPWEPAACAARGGGAPPEEMTAAIRGGEFASRGPAASAPRGLPPRRDRPTALVVFYRALLMAGDTAPIAALMRALEREGIAPVAVALTSLKDPAIAADLEALIAESRPKIILNATAFSALRDDRMTVLDAADVPVLQVVLAGSAREVWAASARGLSSADLAMHVVLPELDGRLMTRAVSFKEAGDRHPRLEHACVRHRPDPGRIAYVATLAAAWARLGETAREERRIAMILSDYPARAGRAGHAVGLDTAASAAQITGLMCDAGFDVGSGIDAEAVEAMLNGAGGDDIAVPLELYAEWLAALPAEARRQIADAWGAPADDPACFGDAFRFRVLRARKLAIALQPDRGSANDRKTGYHDASMPPRHGYLAFYGWLRYRWRVHALIHLGTHGTLEWLPGKALALSESCWPEAVLGPLPVIYPFIVNNPGEAVQAKRRIGAVTIGHLTPPVRKAGLHGRLAELEALVEEYAAADGFDGRRVAALEQAIIDAAQTCGFAAECGLGPADTGRDAIARLDARLCDIKELSIRDSFHVFARQPNSTDRDALVRAMQDAAPTSISDADQARLNAALAASPAREGGALIRALDGRRVEPGPAGAPTRGRFDVLPTGRNLTTIDPRAIPTRTAATIGRLAAEEVIRRHLQDHGDYPRGIVLTMWASASLRTGGDDIVQALHYLGVVPVWDGMSGRVTGVEILPLARLGRPRIDVTLRISGLFRDLFETQIALFDLAVRQVAQRDEEAQDNPLAEARRGGSDLARIFGSAPGSYGGGSATVALDTPWRSRAEIGRAALANVTHSYVGASAAPARHSGFGARLAVSDALIQPQDSAERDALDGDEIADFAGGMAAAAALLGSAPALYHLDTSSPMAPNARSMAESIARAVRGRLTNPRWLAGMLAHGHRGVAEIAQGVDALYAFGAATPCVPPHLFEAVHDALIADEAVFSAMITRNPAAAACVARRLSDALARWLWTARRNAVAEELDVALARAAGEPGSLMEAAE